jgi:glucan phosphoethanolaminetransferase (alkaline phosphatase superfamily)
MCIGDHQANPLPRYFPYWVTVGALSIVFIIIMLWLISQRQLLPGIVIMGSFILFVLWTVGLIVISIQLWGPSGVNGNCGLYVNSNAVKGASTSTLAWLEQHSICM